MELYRISQEANDGYDTYSDAIIAALSSDIAKLIHPGGYYVWRDNRWKAQRADGTWSEEGRYGSWAHSPDQVKVEHIGTAVEGTEEGIICASFHAG